jgi:hypothetical protein
VPPTPGGPGSTASPPPPSDPGHPGKPGVYPGLHLDVSLIDSINTLAKGVSDAGCRNALLSGVQAGLEALTKRTHQDVARIELSQ